MMTLVRSPTTLQRFGLAAFSWSLAFGLLSFVWAAGGQMGAGQLSPGLQEEVARREPGFVTILWLTGAAKVVGGLVPLALAFHVWPRISRRLLHVLTWIGGALLTLYGCGDIVGGTVGALDDNSQNGLWYAVLWGPIWLLGGVLFLGTAWTYRQHDNAPP